MKEFNALTFHRTIGCGNIYIIINENDGDFNNIEIKGEMAKSTACGESWFNSLASILTYALRRSVEEGTTKNAIIKHLCGHRCNNIVANRNHTVSCSDAIGDCIREYIKGRGLENEQQEEKIVTIS